jgi:hypothetical protein
MSLEITQTTQFKIRNLSLVTKFGTFDVSAIFSELNIFDSVLLPCMSGNILLTDAVGLSKRLIFDGSEHIIVDITKDENDNTASLKKVFRVYKQSDRKNLNQNTEAYLLHFISEEFIFSEQKKVSQTYTSSYAEVVTNILNKYLKVPRTKIGMVERTKGNHKVVVPMLSPIDALNWLAKRSVSESNVADYLFFENKAGFNFMSLTKMYSYKPLFSINFQPKNLNTQDFSEFLGVRDFRFSTQFDIIDNIKNGFFASKFVGFDFLTRKFEEVDFDINYHYKNTHLNSKPNAFVDKNRDGKDASQMYESKINLVPFEVYRNRSEYVKFNDNQTATITEDTHVYVPQRKAILHNLVQKKLTVTLPGNFNISSGYILDVKAHTFGADTEDSDGLDKSTSGKYLIIGTRHMIKPEKHETICELASDSTNNGMFYANNPSLQTAKYN